MIPNVSEYKKSLMRIILIVFLMQIPTSIKPITTLVAGEMNTLTCERKSCNYKISTNWDHTSGVSLEADFMYCQTFNPRYLVQMCRRHRPWYRIYRHSKTFFIPYYIPWNSEDWYTRSSKTSFLMEKKERSKGQSTIYIKVTDLGPKIYHYRRQSCTFTLKASNLTWSINGADGYCPDNCNSDTGNGSCIGKQCLCTDNWVGSRCSVPATIIDTSFENSSTLNGKSSLSYNSFKFYKIKRSFLYSMDFLILRYNHTLNYGRGLKLLRMYLHYDQLPSNKIPNRGNKDKTLYVRKYEKTVK